MPPLLVIVGPTASGKSRLAMELATGFGSEIIGADSRQIYRGLDIGTSKPDRKVLQAVPHHLISLVSPDETFSAGEYKRRVESLFRQGKGRKPEAPWIMAGGTGLYIKSVLHGLWEGPSADYELRKKLLKKEAESYGWLYRELTRLDPASSVRIHPNDRSKIVRALEVCYLTGLPLSRLHTRQPFRKPEGECIQIGLLPERETLYRQIDQRVDEMIRIGWIDEVEGLLKAGYDESLPSMRSLGYPVLASHIRGSLSREEAVLRIKKETRHYAKRQMTWFRKDPGIRWLAADRMAEVAATIRERYLNGDRSFFESGHLILSSGREV
jgi:tRNA dimethylallyltransferase